MSCFFSPAIVCLLFFATIGLYFTSILSFFTYLFSCLIILGVDCHQLGVLSILISGGTTNSIYYHLDPQIETVSIFQTSILNLVVQLIPNPSLKVDLYIGQPIFLITFFLVSLLAHSAAMPEHVMRWRVNECLFWV